MDDERAFAIEWDCQKLLQRYYHLMDQRQFDDAVNLFTDNVLWQVGAFELHGREAMRNAFGNTDLTMRHILSNSVVQVIDEDHADATSYVTSYVEKDVRDDKPVPFHGPHRLGENYDKLVRTTEGWRIAERRGKHAFARSYAATFAQLRGSTQAYTE